MFTGIIIGLGRIKSLKLLGGEIELHVEAEFDWGDSLIIGESIAVSGACLTVSRADGKSFWAHVSAESISRTSLKDLKAGDAVNLERALRLSDRLGGHLVTGHVDDAGRIKSIGKRDQSLVFEISASEAASELIIEKGSIAIDGISLTVNETAVRSFKVNVIPHTAEATTLKFRKPGDYVNLETDLIGKYVARFVKGDKGESKISKSFLAEHGFL